jgi:tetratricopeptide (TPR) repeat protein
MKPGLITIPENSDTIALVNRSFVNESNPFKYFNGKTIVTDTTIKYKALSDICIKSFEGFLKEKSYFKKVINLQDSLPNLVLSNKIINDPEEVFQQTKSDICIFLDQFNFSLAAVYGLGDVTTNMVALSWRIVIKNDSLSYLYNQMDTLIYDPFDLPVAMDTQKRLQAIVDGSSSYLGRFAGSKIIPNWMPVQRLYYKSNNPNMLLAEGYALQNDWLKAAGLWNRLTNNKNRKIAAKASYNMALACEMEGKHDVAIDWLVKSFSILKQNSEEHKENCQRYIAILTQRKKELEKLTKQVRNN